MSHNYMLLLMHLFNLTYVHISVHVPAHVCLYTRMHASLACHFRPCIPVCVCVPGIMQGVIPIRVCQARVPCWVQTLPRVYPCCCVWGRMDLTCSWDMQQREASVQYSQGEHPYPQSGQVTIQTQTAVNLSLSCEDSALSLVYASGAALLLG